MSSPVRPVPDSAPLLGILHELLGAYRTYTARADDLISALVANDFTAMQAAVAAQTVVVGQVERVERSRRAAVEELAQAITGRLPLAGEPRRSVTMSALLMLLPPDQADQLAGIRHDLLATLVQLQRLQQQATVLVRNAQTVVGRALGAGGPVGAAYGAQGERPMPRQDLYTQRGRWA